jgi:hypothetical protein
MKAPVWLKKIGMKLSEKSPALLIFGGGIMIAGGGVVAVVQSIRKVPDILDDHEIELAQIECDRECGEDDKECKKLIAKENVRTGLELAKTYAIPVGMGVTGFVMMGIGYGKFNKKYLAVVGLLDSSTAFIEKYRSRIVEKYGEAADRWAAYGQEEKEVIEEDGSVSKEYFGTENELPWNSPYYRVIDKDAFIYKECNGSPLHIRSQLECYQSMLNEQYLNGTPIFINDVYKWIFGANYEHMSDEGQYVGWYLHDPINKENLDERHPINLRIQTFNGKVGDDDAFDRDCIYVAIDPNVAGVVSLARGKENKSSISTRRHGGKYISM